MRLADVARTWLASGVSCIPIQANQTKRPAVRWADYQVTAPSLGQVDEWWGNGNPYGLALICGSVSGNLEMLELEGRATSGEFLSKIMVQVQHLDIVDLWYRLTADGYSEMSPSGGLHLLYRIIDNEVPGNTKIAHNEDGLVLAETRGEGGYVITAPTPGTCHPSGEAWELLTGTYGQLPEVTWRERCLLHEAIRLALDNPPPDPSPTPQLPAVLPRPPLGSSTAGLSPGDHFEQATDWAEILEPHGWLLESQQGHTRHWTRPGKDRREGASATTGHADDRDRLYVFSTSTVFRQETPVTKFAAYTILNHGGDFHAAAVELKRQGFGQVTPVSSGVVDLLPDSSGQYKRYEANDQGNTRQLHDRVQDRFRFFREEKEYICWDGVKWSHDQRYVLEREYTTMVEELLAQARASGDDSWAKWWVRAGNRARLDAAIKGLRSMEGFTVTADELNLDRKVLNLQNGIMDLMSGQLLPHDPGRMMTRAMGASYKPTAECPRFESFMEKVLPEPDMRRYVQRALGYSLLGDADQRSLFLVCGPSGTGKSTLMATMEMVFGDYGVPAPPGTLRAARSEGSSPSNDLHMLRGKRFVSTSETNEHTAYNEDLIKRLTGRDRISSRRLYQDFQDWSPVCTIWLATNHPPRFSSDDDAIWRRAKIVPFNTVLLGENEIPDFAHNVLEVERDGIFNWLLAGLREYLMVGLAEPNEVQETAHDVRMQSDPVARFIEDQLNDGLLIHEEEQRIKASELYSMYQEWARKLGERSLGSRRFTHRITASYPDVVQIRVNGNYYWRGVGRATNVGILGTFMPGG